MEINEAKPTEEQKVREKTIPVFTVLKNGAILKNIFVVNSRDFSSPERNGNAVRDDDEVEEILLVGRHPDCDILLTHPSISRFHLQIRSLPSRQKLFVTDLSSVHGTWVTDQKVEPDACVEVKEGDVIRIGGSTRIYRLHWISLSRAYDIHNPFIPQSIVTVMEQEEDNKMLQAENLESVANTALGDDGEHQSQGSGSTVRSDSEDAYNRTMEISLLLPSPSVLTVATDSVYTQKLQFNEDLHTSTKWDLDGVEAAAEKPSSCCTPSGGFPDGLDCSELEISSEADECVVRGDGPLYLNVLSGMMETLVPNEDEDPYLAAKESSSLPLSSDSIETEKLQLTEDVQASPKLAIDIIEANAEYPSSGCYLSKEKIGGCFESPGFTAFELASDAEILSFCHEVSGESEFVTKRVMEASAGPLNKAEIQSRVDNREIEFLRQVIAVSPNSSPQAEQLLTEDARSLLGFEFQREVCTDTVSENLRQKSNEVKPGGDENRNPETNIETENVFDEGTSLCFSLEQSGTQSFLSLANLNPETEISIGSEGSEDSYNLSETAVKGNTDKEVPLSSTFAAETYEDTKPIGKMPSFCTKSQENQTQQQHAVRDDTLSEIDSSKRGKAASVQSLEASGCSAFELTAQVGILSHCLEVSGENGFFTEKAMEASGETGASRKIIAVSYNARSSLGSEVAIETNSENLDQNNYGKTKISSRHASAVSGCLFARNGHLSRINTEDNQSLCSSWMSLTESEVNPEGNQIQISAINRETEKIIDEGSSSSCLSEDLKPSGTQSFFLTPCEKPKTEMSIGSGRSGVSCTFSLREIEGKGKTDKGSPIPSTLGAETFEDTKTFEELPSDCTESHENQTPQTNSVGDGVLLKIDSSRSYSRRLNRCNIWSRRGKAASVLQIRTDNSKARQRHIGNEPKAQLQRKQALCDKSISLIVPRGAEKLEPEIFTPDKENLTPSSHMLKRLQDVGDIKDSKSSSKLSGKSCSSKIPSSIAVFTSGALTEPEIFTPDKENLIPDLHMLKRLREVVGFKESKGSSSSKATHKPFFDIHVEENKFAEQKPDLCSLSSKSNVKHDESVARAPLQPLLEKSSSDSQYTVASSAASARNNISRGIRSSSNLSDGKRKMKWTILLDTCSLLDEESRKPLRLLQGLKGTHLVVPRTVLRDLKETKRTSSLIFRRREEMASSALDWIEECKVNEKWWIQLQSPCEETKANAATPRAIPQSALNWNAPEIGSPTSEDQVLECALVYKKRNSHEKLVVLSSDASFKIKAMAEGVMCETAKEFYESLVNPLSERFMWRGSLPRGRTWSHLDDVVLRERYSNGGATAKGLKLLLLHNSHYGSIRIH